MATPSSTRLVGSILVLLVTTSSAAAAQQRSAQEWLSQCQDGWGGDRAHFCEVRTLSLPLPSGTLSVDGGQNGGITVTGGDVPDVRIEARLEASGEDAGAAEAFAKQIRIVTDGGRIRAEGPSQGGGSSWAVSYHVTVPSRTDLDLRTYNGGIGVANVSGRLRFSAENGAIRLTNVGGDVHGETVNGGVDVALGGSRYTGAGLDVATSNGVVRLEVPSSYSARLETGTVNGRISTDIPFTVQGEYAGHTLTTALGEGGALVRVVTHNGAVHVRRAS